MMTIITSWNSIETDISVDNFIPQILYVTYVNTTKFEIFVWISILIIHAEIKLNPQFELDAFIYDTIKDLSFENSSLSWYLIEYLFLKKFQ